MCPQDVEISSSFFVVGAIVAPVAEEVFFRGVLYGFFRRWGAFIAVVISTVLFVIAHPIGSGVPWQQIAGGYTLCGGIRGRRKSGSTYRHSWPGKSRYLYPVAHILSSVKELACVS